MPEPINEFAFKTHSNDRIIAFRSRRRQKTRELVTAETRTELVGQVVQAGCPQLMQMVNDTSFINNHVSLRALSRTAHLGHLERVAAEVAREHPVDRRRRVEHAAVRIGKVAPVHRYVEGRRHIG